MGHLRGIAERPAARAAKAMAVAAAALALLHPAGGRRWPLRDV